MPVRSFGNRQLGIRMAGAEKSSTRVENGAAGPLPYTQILDFQTAASPSKTTADFLKELPSYDSNNFSRFQRDASHKNATKRSTVYCETRDHPCEQIITTEKTTILLRYLQQQYEKKQKTQMKRDSENAGPSGTAEPIPRKRTRLQNREN